MGRNTPHIVLSAGSFALWMPQTGDMSIPSSDHHSAPDRSADSAPRPARRKNWGALILLAVVLIALLIAAFFILSAVIPVQWAHFVGGHVQGRVATGSWYGFLAGLTLTWLSLTIAWQARRRMSWAWRLVLIVLALLVSVPNLLTAAVAFGTTEAVHAAQRIIAVDATFFPSATGWGAAAAGVLFVVGAITGIMFRSRGRKLKELKKSQAEARSTSSAL